MTRHATWIGLAVSFAGCTSHQPKAEQVEQDPTEVAPAPPPVVQAPPAAIEKPPEPPPSPRETPIVPVPATTQWRELPGMELIVDFHPFVYGVLAICGPDGFEDICKLRDDDTLEETPVDFPESEGWSHLLEISDDDNHVMTGNWRSDAWMVSYEAHNVVVPDEEPDERGDIEIDFDTMLALRKLRTDAWFPSPIGDEKWVKRDSDQLIRKGWAGGMLVHDSYQFIRVPAASEPPAPTRGQTKPGKLIDFFEATSGRLYTVVMMPGDPVTFVQRPCNSQNCVIANATPLSPNGWWDFGIDIPRGNDSISVITRQVGEGEEIDYLLHFDAGTAGGAWALDRWPTSEQQPVPTILWPDTREGLWTKAGDALWYRDAKGAWFDVALPFEVEAGDVVRFANRMKPREFLVLLVRGGVGRVFATEGPVRAP